MRKGSPILVQASFRTQDSARHCAQAAPSTRAPAPLREGKLLWLGNQGAFHLAVLKAVASHHQGAQRARQACQVSLAPAHQGQRFQVGQLGDQGLGVKGVQAAAVAGDEVQAQGLKGCAAQGVARSCVRG